MAERNSFQLVNRSGTSRALSFIQDGALHIVSTDVGCAVLIEELEKAQKQADCTECYATLAEYKKKIDKIPRWYRNILGL